MMDKLMKQLERHEGYRQHVYKCSAGKWTIGIGRMVEPGGPGLSLAEARMLLENDIKRVLGELVGSKHGETFKSLSDARRDVLLNMGFNLGVPGLLKFEKMWAALGAGDYQLAASEMLSSLWARQVGGRAVELAQQMADGR